MVVSDPKNKELVEELKTVVCFGLERVHVCLVNHCELSRPGKHENQKVSHVLICQQHSRDD